MAAKRSTKRQSNRGGGQASRRTGSGARSGSGRRMPVAWGITGLAMGLMIALIVHLEHRRSESPDTMDRESGAPAASEETGPDDGGNDQPRFEFYRLLNEQEVEVADETDEDAPAPQGSEALPEADPPADPETETQTPAPEADTKRYLLQAGSFREAADADSMKASLALLGIEARIQVVELPGGETWHRVRVGPFTSLEQVNGVRARMADQEIESILLRAGGG